MKKIYGGFTRVLLLTLGLAWASNAAQVPMRQWAAHEKGITAIAFAPDSRTVATAGADQTIKLWSVPEGTLLWSLPDRGTDIFELAFAPDGSTLVSAEAPASDAALWMNQGSRIEISRTHGTKNNVARLWDAHTGTLLRTLPGPDIGIHAVAYWPDAQTVAIAGLQKEVAPGGKAAVRGIVQMYDKATGELRRSVPAPYGTREFSSDGKTVAAIDDSPYSQRRVQLQDTQSGQTWGTPFSSTGYHDIAFSPDGKQLITSDGMGAVKVWDVATAKVTQQLASDVWVQSIALSRDETAGVGRLLATAGERNGVMLWDARNGGLLQTLYGGSSGLVEFSPDGRWMAGGNVFTRYTKPGTQAHFNLWDVGGVRTLNEVAPPSRLEHAQGLWSFPLRAVEKVSFTPDGRGLVAANGHELHGWDITTGKLLPTLDLKLTHPIRVTVPTSDAPDYFYQQRVNAFSPDGKLAVVAMVSNGSVPTRLQLRDVMTDTVKWTLPVTTGIGTTGQVTFSANGKTLAEVAVDETKYSNDDRGLLRLWDAVNGRLLHTLKPHALMRHAGSLALSPDGKTVAVPTGYHLELQDVPSGKPRRMKHFIGRDYGVAVVAFSPDGHLLATAGRDYAGRENRVRICDAATGKLLRTLFHTGTITALLFSPDSTLLAAVGGRKTEYGERTRPSEVRVWKVTQPLIISGTLRATLRLRGTVSALAFSPNGSTLALGRPDEMVTLWNINGEAFPVPDSLAPPVAPSTRILRGHIDDVNALDFSADAKILASADRDGTVPLWDVASGEWLRTPLRRLPQITALAIAADGSTLATAEGQFRQKGTVKIWDGHSGKLLKILSGHTDEVAALAFAPDGKTLASGDWGETVKIWDARTGSLLRTLQSGTGAVFTLSFSSDSSTLAVAGEARIVNLWDAHSGELRQTLRGDNFGIAALAFSSDGKTLYSAAKDGPVQSWEITTDKLATLPEDKPVDTLNTKRTGAVAIAPGGSTLATASNDALVYLERMKWDHQ